MKREKVWRITSVVAVMLLLVVGLAYAQRRKQQMHRMPHYDTTTEVTLRGTIVEIESHKGRMGWAGTHLVVSFETETLNVHLGPSSYLAQQGFSFAAGEQIEVTGSRTKLEGSDVLIAREVRKEGKVLTLRNSDGIPAWSRNRWRW